MATSMAYGMKCGFFGGDVLKLIDDIRVLKPTFFPSVPRLFNRIYGKITDGMKQATGVKKWLVDKAVTAKLYYLRNGEGLIHKFYDAVVFSKMKAMLGGNVRLMITGSAPLAGEVQDFIKVCFCAPMIEGYGLTETSGGATLTDIDDVISGTVGGPI